MVGCRNSIQCEREPEPSYQHYLKTTLQNVLMFYIYDGRCGGYNRVDISKKVTRVKMIPDRFTLMKCVLYVTGVTGVPYVTCVTSHM